MMLHDPRVRQHLVRGESSGRIGVHAAHDKILRLRRHALQDGGTSRSHSVLDFLEHLAHRRGFVRHLAHETLVRQNADRPAVDRGAVARLTLGSQPSLRLVITP